MGCWCRIIVLCRVSRFTSKSCGIRIKAGKYAVMYSWVLPFFSATAASVECMQNRGTEGQIGSFLEGEEINECLLFSCRMFSNSSPLFPCAIMLLALFWKMNSLLRCHRVSTNLAWSPGQTTAICQVRAEGVWNFLGSMEVSRALGPWGQRITQCLLHKWG